MGRQTTWEVGTAKSKPSAPSSDEMPREKEVLLRTKPCLPPSSLLPMGEEKLQCLKPLLKARYSPRG